MNKQIYKINLYNDANQNICIHHDISYILWSPNLLQEVTNYLKKHHYLVYQRDYSTTEHNCSRYYDFNRIFCSNVPPEPVDEKECCIKQSILKRDTETFNERLLQTLQNHREICDCNVQDVGSFETLTSMLKIN